MSKADEKSKQYRDFREQCGIKDPVMLNEIEEACCEGYHQAEKDNELTLDDIKMVIEIADKLVSDNIDELIDNGEEWYYKEVLKRFKEIKGNIYGE